MKKKLFGIALLLMGLGTINVNALSKTETVYANLDNTGSIKNTNISVQLTNLDKGDILDYSKLEDIKNVNGEEKFTRESEKITWKSTGKDIYYKGKFNTELPISVSVKYYLNGEEKSLKDITGKSGSIKMVFDFKNNAYDYNSHMYTPFVVSTFSMIDAKNNSNVAVSTGKVINAGGKDVVVGLSAPGLYESTNIAELKDMNHLEISYDTTKFKMSDVYFAITPKLLDEVDISGLDKIGSVSGSLNTLSNGVNELKNGSNSLYEGSSTLTNGLTELNKGLKDALDGSNSLYEGLSQVQSGTGSISSLTTLVEQLYASLKSNTELLNNITSGVTAEQLQAGIIDATNKKTDLENKLVEVNAGIAGLEQLEQAGLITEEQATQLATLRGTKDQLEAGINQYAAGIAEAQNNLQSLPQAAAKISGANEVIAKVLCGVLGAPDVSYVNDDAINAFKEKINALVDGVNALADGAKKLNNGLGLLYEGSNKLVEGSNKLTDGNKQLLDGITKLNDEGISKLNYYGNIISNYSGKIETLINLSKNYKGFSSDNADKVIFIYKLSK